MSAVAKEEAGSVRTAGLGEAAVDLRPSDLSYAETMGRLAALEEQARELKERETRLVIEQIKTWIQVYGLCASDLGFARSPREQNAKYRKSANEVWSGARGRRPKWVSEAIANGEDMEAYRIKPSR